MERKPIILILTSRDEVGDASHNVAAAVRALGTHNVVVLSDEQYGSPAKGLRLDTLMILGQEYQQLIEKKLKPTLGNRMRQKVRGKKLSGRANRINNAVRRFRPELILAMTPYAHYAATDAKKHAEFGTHIIYMMPGFTADRRDYDNLTDIFIVENADMKAEMVRKGIPSKRIMTMGLPYDVRKPTFEEIALSKQELGLPRTPTVMLNAGTGDGADELLALLSDQGGVINVAAVATDPKLLPAYRACADSASGRSTVALITKPESFSEYLAASDVVITKFDPSVIYKCFKLGKPVITFGKGDHTSKQINFLVSKGLVVRSKDNIDIVGLLYRLLQTGAAVQFAEAGEKWVEMSSIENIANYLTSYIAL